MSPDVNMPFRCCIIVVDELTWDMCGKWSEICPEMHALAKMAEMAPNCQNRQTVNKNSNEMAKGPFKKWRFWQKWHIWRLIAKIAKL